MTLPNPGRLASIDVFRALTMFLMIFVNDLWTLHDIPEWLEHVPAEVDGLGLADVVFPMFLFIVGLSIPLAINHRLAKGDSKLTILKHTILRSFALITMGVFHVNLESYSDAALLPKQLWEILITLSSFLLWLDYPKSYALKKKYSFQAAGAILLLAMAIVYRGGSAANPEWITTQWWGILGLIGWSYLICSGLYLLFPRRTVVHLALMVVLLLFSAAEKLHWLDFAKTVRSYFWIVSDGSLPAVVMGGIVATCLYLELRSKNFFIVAVVASLAMIFICFISRPLWGIHKIGASPSWVTLCVGISLLCFAILVWFVDLKKKESWFKILKPAGTSTLTAYLLPYFHYSVISWTGVTLPLFLRTGDIGLIKSLIYALVIVLITGFLENRKLRLKI